MLVTLLIEGTPNKVDAISYYKSLSLVNVMIIIAFISLYFSLFNKNLRMLNTYVEYDESLSFLRYPSQAMSLSNTFNPFNMYKPIFYSFNLFEPVQSIFLSE